MGRQTFSANTITSAPSVGTIVQMLMQIISELTLFLPRLV